MNKTEFLERLSFFLQDLSSEDRDKVLKYYSNYIDAAGKDKEEETISNLGSINLLAQQIRTEGVEKYEIETPVEIENKEEKQEEKQHEEKVVGDSMNQGAATAYSNARSGRNYYSSVAGNNYNSYQNRNGEYNNNNNNYNNYSTNNNNHNSSRILLLLVVIISFPIWFSVLMTVLGCLFGVIVAILGVIFGFGVACVSLIVTGFSLVGIAIWHLVSMPLVSAGLIGCGVLLVGIGLLFMGITLALASKVLPGIVGVIGKMFSSISRRKAGRF